MPLVFQIQDVFLAHQELLNEQLFVFFKRVAFQPPFFMYNRINLDSYMV
jgi:hypothetical protein